MTMRTAFRKSIAGLRTTGYILLLLYIIGGAMCFTVAMLRVPS